MGIGDDGAPMDGPHDYHDIASLGAYMLAPAASAIYAWNKPAAMQALYISKTQGFTMNYTPSGCRAEPPKGGPNFLFRYRAGPPHGGPNSFIQVPGWGPPRGDQIWVGQTDEHLSGHGAKGLDFWSPCGPFLSLWSLLVPLFWVPGWGGGFMTL